ncbi:ATPase WRNIP1 C26H5.02c [Grifola frondosa]|uniref:ATPase WRNIP1 C26H5.02c n=1 Tax=Grifola frondosa TaxID=5627 RepID=A0A1C7LVG2_GRIFR|nr:ATPase WRNIP1 C26H5.02c [Grifola frondosa]
MTSSYLVRASFTLTAILGYPSSYQLKFSPVCSRPVLEQNINQHLDSNCADDPQSNMTTSKGKAGPSRAHTLVQPSIESLFPEKSSLARISTPTSRNKHPKKRSEADDAPSLPEQGPSKRHKTTASSRIQANAPLAERLRPRTLAEFVGQPHLTGPGSLLMHLLESGSTGSIIFWGPPGCGKTTLARLLANSTDSVFKELSATDSGISDVRAVVEEAKRVLALTGRRTILFLDEVHRFNKAQQDIFLPFIEQGQIQLIGATTENPSFKLTGALISRCRVFVLERLTDEDVTQIINQAVERVLTTAHQSASEVTLPTMTMQGSSPAEPSSSPIISSQASTSTAVSAFSPFPQLTPKIVSSIVSLSTGDARTALSLLELVLSAPPDADQANLLTSLRRSVSTSYDRTGDSHYDMISALHKSVRGSQGSAALYWLARMLTAGEDPLYIARRMVVCASEDIGLADNHALPLAIATLQACQIIGMPECRINLAHLVSYLSEAPKSTRSYEAYNRAEEAAKLDPTIPVPVMIRNAPTKLMKELGYARGYCYNPEYAYVYPRSEQRRIADYDRGHRAMLDRHPVTNDYLPIQFRGDVFLRKEGDVTDKIWDEAALRRWEVEENGGKPWSGRQTREPNREASNLTLEEDKT